MTYIATALITWTIIGIINYRMGINTDYWIEELMVYSPVFVLLNEVSWISVYFYAWESKRILLRCIPDEGISKKVLASLMRQKMRTRLWHLFDDELRRIASDGAYRVMKRNHEIYEYTDITNQIFVKKEKKCLI